MTGVGIELSQTLVWTAKNPTNKRARIPVEKEFWTSAPKIKQQRCVEAVNVVRFYNCKYSAGIGGVFTANALITPPLNPERALLPNAIVSPPTHCQWTTVVCHGPKLRPDPVILESHPLKSRKLVDGIQYTGICCSR